MKTANATEPYTLLRGLVGSTVHGLALAGTDDRDEMAVAVEPPEFLIGLARAKFDLDGGFQQGFEHRVERTKPEGQRSQAGDLDRTTYSLRKFMRLACAGNPTVLVLLFVPAEMCDVATEDGLQLQESSDMIVSKSCGPRFLGYLHSQKLSLLGERGRKVQRPELEAAHGYDTKYAMHTLRLAMQGIEMMETGRLTLPLPAGDRALLMEVRTGQLERGAVLRLVDEFEQRLALAVAASKLPDEPNWARLNSYLVRTYRQTWGW